MTAKRALLLMVVASAVVLAVGSGPTPSAVAQSEAEASAGYADVLAQEPRPGPGGMTIPYTGTLSDEAGQPVVEGAYDFAFSLYEAETGGETIWSEVQEGVTVRDGNLVALLGSAQPLPTALLGGGDRWLAVGVRGPGETDFTQLTPRQRLSTAMPVAVSSPAGGAACPHDHLGEAWQWGTNTTPGLVMDGSVPWSNGLLSVRNHQNGPAVWAMNDGDGSAVRGDGWGTGIGVYGEGENGPGVAGRSANARGVEGYTTAANAWAPAVYGSNEGAGDGVYGLSAKRNGVFGITESPNPDHAGVYGTNHGAGPAVRADGDLYVTGAFRGNIGPGGGAPFPRPAYDSGWRAIAKGGSVTLDHNLGGNADNYVVHLEFKDVNGRVHNYLYGATTWTDYLGAWWEDLTNQHIVVQRMKDDAWVYQVRVRIWVYR